MKEEEIKKLNIFEKMNLITNEIGVIEKNLKIDVTKTRSYKAVSERDVLDSIKPIEMKYRVFSYPVGRKLIDKDTLTKETELGTSNSLYMRIETTYRFVNIDNPTEFIETTTYGDGIDTGDKASGKAMTYADKYALMKAYKLSTGDDPDKEGSPEKGYKKSKTTTNTNSTPNNDPTPYDFDLMTKEQMEIIASMDIELKEKIRNQFKKDPMKLTKLEAEATIKSALAKGLIKTKQEQELEKKTNEEAF